MRCGPMRSTVISWRMKPPPQYQQPPDDPQYLALKAQADQDNINATENRVQIDSASLLARYGSRLTLAASGGASAAGASPTMAASPTAQPPALWSGAA